ncbi:peptidoglycan recognition protein family protein [Brevibacillus laterosporus]|uniref:peptidoglycan recognition protein family protein n=1 Tax=Brevibacillus laterosporus TaxID=1465 RepID=UPI000E6C5966|nr:peptidoglycan recognition family protein [Brevibacillus laterosporus]AYB38383.1 N-acetylmuramoyl-L-alanine amidase [Brevibacillus laterosporus]MBM7110392.1 N-acetyl-anhydromuranmyl-L-alanine amidase [Brevibacillus laterosporus]
MFIMKYPIQTKYLTPRTKRRSGIPMNRVGFIVAHDTGNPGSTAFVNISYYQNTCNSMSASAHTFIDDTSICECIPATTGKPEKAWHVLYDVPLDNQWFGGDANDIAIGVELCYGEYRKNGTIKQKINDSEAYKRYVWYIAYLCYLYGLLPEQHIVGHCDLDPKRKLDPTKNAFSKMNITWKQFIQDVVKEYEVCSTKSKTADLVLAKLTERNEEELKLAEWQFDMLTQALTDLTRKGYLTDNTWVEKAKSKTLTQSELSFIMTVVLQRNLIGEIK